MSLRGLAGVLAVAMALGGLACTSNRVPDASPATSTSSPAPLETPTTQMITIPGTPRTTTTLAAALQAGEATLSGTVTGDGDLAGVVVRVEQFVGDSVAATEVPVSGNSWSLEGIPGGRYRVTAYRIPDLGQLNPELFFLGATEKRTVNLTLNKVGGDSGITATLTPSPPALDRPAKLTVQIGGSSVDSQGHVSISPRAGVPVQLSVSGGIILESEPARVTDRQGFASWQLRCTAVGTFPVFLIFDNGRSPVNLPPCGS